MYTIVNLKSQTMRSIIAISLLTIIFMTACNETETFNGNLEQGQITNFHEQLDPPLTSFFIEANLGGRFITDRNSILSFEPNIFEDQNGQSVTGQVEIQVLELLTKSEILMYGIHTYCDGKLLESGGEFKVEAFQNGEQLQLKEGKNYSLFVENSSPRQSAELFYANEENNEWVEADQDSETQNNVSIAEILASETIGWVFGYESFPEKLGWINVDWFYQDPSAGFQKVELPSGYGISNTLVFGYFHGLNSVLELWHDPNIDRYFLYGPIGETVDIITITNYGDDNYKYSRTEIQISQDDDLSVLPQPKSIEEINDELSKLGS